MKTSRTKDTIEYALSWSGAFIVMIFALTTAYGLAQFSV